MICIGIRPALNQPNLLALRPTLSNLFAMHSRAAIVGANLSTSNLPGGQMRCDVSWIEGRPRERADAIGRLAGEVGLRFPHRRLVQIGAEDGPRGRKQLGREWRLAPAHHLRVEPSGLPRLGTAGAFA